MVCPRCERIRDLPVQEDAFSTEDQIVLQRTIEDLRDGVAASCWWCSDIARWLLKQIKDTPLHEIHSFRSKISRYGREYLVDLLYKPHQDDSEQEDSMTLNCHKLSSAVKLQGRTDSSQSWQYIQRRLTECDDLHKETCGRSGLEKHSPTWLLKIEEQPNSARRCRLVRSSSEASIEEYVTMSHRWQPELMDQKKLCISNLKDYQNHIPMEELPKHYADAVEVTWKLGFKYLWIDFLCMIQDSEDLGQEIARMTQIYQNAYCNLSAASADEGTEGLFFDRDYLRLPRIFRASDNDYQCVMRSNSCSLFEALDSEPLYRRGWVCQERLLARRNISFTKDLVFIECHSSMDCELGPAINGGNGPLDPAGVKFTFGSRAEYAALYKLERGDLLPFWAKMVEFYSRSKLTYSDDRLTAISGLARYIANVTGIDYLAGLWNSRLAYQLAWYRNDPPPFLPPPVSSKDGAKVDRAPSWSWANIDGPVSFSLPRSSGHISVAEILEAKCQGPHEFESTGFIRLHAWVIPFRNQKNAAMRFAPYFLAACHLVDVGLTRRLAVYWDAFPAEKLTSAQIFQKLSKNSYALPLFFDDSLLEGIVVTLTPTKEFRRVGKWCIDLLHDPNEQRSEGPAITRPTEQDEYFVRDAPYTVRALMDVLGECDLPFLETVYGERRLITLV